MYADYPKSVTDSTPADVSSRSGCERCCRRSQFTAVEHRYDLGRWLSGKVVEGALAEWDHHASQNGSGGPTHVSDSYHNAAGRRRRS